MGRKAADFDQFQIRLPPGMREQIKLSAEENVRSMNAEIVQRLEESFDVPKLRAELLTIAQVNEQIERTLTATEKIVDVKDETLNAVRHSLFYATWTAIDCITAIQMAANGDDEALKRLMEKELNYPTDLAKMKERFEMDGRRLQKLPKLPEDD